MIHARKTNNRKGFTIVELLIATTVLSVILLLVTTMMINIGNLFDKGINQSRTQDDTRTIIDDVSQNLKLDGANPSFSPTVPVSIQSKPYTETAVCIGATRYSYVIGIEAGTSSTSSNPQIPHVMWRDTTPSGGCAAPVKLDDPSTIPPGNNGNGTEMIAPNSRLTVFSITGNQVYNIDVGVAYGDDDLLINATSPSSNPNAACVGNAGDQFCATSELKTTVVQRL